MPSKGRKEEEGREEGGKGWGKQRGIEGGKEADTKSKPVLFTLSSCMTPAGFATMSILTSGSETG